MPKQSPFKFLDAYKKEDAEVFFGRSQETEVLYEKVVASNLTLLYGASGTGKTSLVSCGLSNRFAETDWYDVLIRRMDDIITSFWKELNNHAESEIKIPDFPQDPSDWKELDYAGPLRGALKSLYLDYYVPIYLIFDQFEELFVLGSKDEQEHFFQMLTVILESGLPVKVLLIMREEYLAHMSVHEKILPYLLDNRFRLERMNRVHLEEVISNTTKAYQIKIEDEDKTVDKIIEQLRDKREGVDLTYLQVYLDRLYRKATGQDQSTDKDSITFNLKLVEDVGKLEDVLEAFLGEQIEQVEKELQAQFKTNQKDVPLLILYALVSNEFTKRSLDVDAILAYLPSDKEITPNMIRFCLDKLIERRIIRGIDED